MIHDYDEIKRAQIKALKQDRRTAAKKAFPNASSIAAKHGLSLVRKSDFHYQLRSPSDCWLINFYPGNCRLYSDKNLAKAPWLGVQDPVTLLRVVERAIEVGRDV